MIALEFQDHSLSRASQPDEVFNGPSKERRYLLSKLKHLVDDEPVQGLLWASLYVCDISRLRAIIWKVNAERPMEYLGHLDVSTTTLLLKWVQDFATKAEEYSNDGSSTASYHTASQEQACVVEVEDLVRKRDGRRCVLTGATVYEVANILPESVVSEITEPASDSDAPDFWTLLGYFFDPDRVQGWLEEMLQDPSDPNKVTDGCHNRICLDQTAHDLWREGAFSLRPLAASEDAKELTVQFHWHPKQSHTAFDAVDLLNVPVSSRDSSSCSEAVLYTVPDELRPDGVYRAKTGDVFVLKTENPITHPLPIHALLDLHWCLSRMMTMSGIDTVKEGKNGGEESGEESSQGSSDGSSGEGSG